MFVSNAFTKPCITICHSQMWVQIIQFSNQVRGKYNNVIIGLQNHASQMWVQIILFSNQVRGKHPPL